MQKKIKNDIIIWMQLLRRFGLSFDSVTEKEVKNNREMNEGLEAFLHNYISQMAGYAGLLSAGALQTGADA
jgi:hypothetical protein